MAYPTNTLSLVLEDIDRRAVSVKDKATRSRAAMLAGNVYATDIVDLFIRFKDDRAALVAAAGTSGIGAYAQNAKNLPTLDVVAEFNAMVSAIDGVTTWITNNFPKDANGFLLRETWGAGGPVDRSFTTAQTAGLQSALATLIATIA